MTMKYKIPKKINQIIGLGAVAGMRTMAAPALLSHYLHHHPSKRIRGTNLHFIQTGKAATIFKILAAGELIGDKLPFTPNRTEPGGLIGRGVAGALVGAALASTQGKKYYAAGAGIGMLSALVSTYVFYLLRKKLTDNTLLPGAYWGVMEDVLAVKGGQKVLEP